MNKRVINLEINEVSPELIKKYIKNNKNSNLSKLMYKKNLSIYTTKALDISKDKLYPSQTWASFNSGKPYSEHKCYWYSDKLKAENLIWNKLVKRNLSVGIVGSIHSSKYPKELYLNQNYKFYLPDCFSNKFLTKPKFYESFQSFNNLLVGQSARVTGLNSLFKTLNKFLIKIITNSKRFGISFFSLKMIIRIIYFSIIYKNKELIRMAQFPLLASIYCDLFKRYKPDYSTLFSNHVAGNMHRYWYAFEKESFKNKNKYSKEWVKKNKPLIYLGIDLLDDFIGFLLNKDELKDVIVLITSSMGQEANPEFDNKFLAKYDGKIIDMNLFLKNLKEYQNKFYGDSVELNFDRNMAPQYGFNVKHQSKLEINKIQESITAFLAELGFVSKVEEENNSIVLSLDPYTDINFQNKYSLRKANNKFAKYGLKFFPIKDHHSGAHCENGSLVVINSNEKFNQIIDLFLEDGNYINYLNFNKLISSYFKNK